ncbi:MAG: YraN family protein [Phycisphaeraceae bacterium]|nr:MAG: YraN family protein [Phycisphaeraceae bacterium]
MIWRFFRVLGLGRSDDVWTRGERAAERLLRRQRYRLLGRNVRTAIGEVDLLFEAPDGRTIVIVEVKARVVGPADHQRLPERAVTPAKARKLVSLAQALARKHRWTDRPMRIDVVAVEFAAGSRKPGAIRHHVGAIDADARRA